MTGVQTCALPISGRRKAEPEDKAKTAQRMLLTWIVNNPGLYGRIRKYISEQDFTEGVSRRVAERLFQELEQGTFNPAGIISMFGEEEVQICCGVSLRIRGGALCP